VFDDKIKIGINKYGSLICALWFDTDKFVSRDPEREEKWQDIKKHVVKLKRYNDFGLLCKFFGDVSVFEKWLKEENKKIPEQERRKALFGDLIKSARKVAELYDFKEEAEKDLGDPDKFSILWRLYYFLEDTMPRFEEEFLNEEKEKEYYHKIHEWVKHKPEIKTCLEVVEGWSGIKLLPVRISFIPTASPRWFGSLASLGFGLYRPHELHITIYYMPKDISYSGIIHEASHSYTWPRKAEHKEFFNHECGEKVGWIVNKGTGLYDTPYITFAESWNRACHRLLYKYVAKHGIREKKHHFGKPKAFYKMMIENDPPFGCVNKIYNALKIELPADEHHKQGDHQKFIDDFIEKNKSWLKSKNSRPEEV